MEDHLYLTILERFECKFVAQGLYEARIIFESLNLAWSVLRAFPKELLKNIDKKTLNQSSKKTGQCKGWRCSSAWQGRDSQQW